MRIIVHSTADLGLAVRAARRAGKIRLDDLAAIAEVSKQFTSDVEHGKPTVQLGLVLKLLSELGVPLELDLPGEAARVLTGLRAEGGIPPTRKRTSPRPGGPMRGS